MNKFLKNVAMICGIAIMITIIPTKSVFGEEKNVTKSTKTIGETIKAGFVSTNGANLNVRSSANASAKILGKLANKSNVEIVGSSINGWYKIKYNNGYGYVSSSYITLNVLAETVKVGYVSTNGANLNVRSSANASAKALGKLADKSKVEIVSSSISGWYKIKYNNGYGYVSSAYITLNAPAETVQVGYVSTNGANLNVRSSANASAKALGKLADKSKVEIVSSSISGWYKIKYNNGYGYVSSAYISLKQPTTTTSNTADIDLGKVGQRIANFNKIGYNIKSSSSVNYRGYLGECVWYVRGRADEKGFKTYGIRGNANEWFKKAKAYGAATSTDVNAVKSNSIMCRGNGKYGHVVFIEYVDTKSSQKWVYYTEANVEAPYSDGKISLGDGKLKKLSFNDFKTKVAKSGNGFQGYIYLTKK